MKLSLLLALLLAAAGIIAALWGNAELRRANVEAQQASTQKGELQRQLVSLQDPEVGALAERFATLRAQGFFDPPQSRAIIARWRAAQKNPGIAKARHALEAPQLLADGLLQQNHMDIELEVVHEQKFVDFWHALDWSLPLQIKHCTLERARENLVPTRPGIKANCQVHWLTAAPSGETP
ncbi:hypothetical protein AGMMS49545_21530 [Betaproteobacteria bacterium]|nr:hypothetical protein AGMMS49545_21530 [Betaproteobacteria bacterium]GHU40110.1 hypothetical protein AGMMS50289_01180 [Betaproteobacteria bacterium]